MSIAKQEQYDLETRIHTFRYDHGVVAIREYLMTDMTALTKTWPNLTGDELIKAQGMATKLLQMLRIIDDGPKHKAEIKSHEGAPQ